MTESAAFETALHSEGYSTTAVREKVFKALQNREPQTMAELVRACQGVDRASVYRSVSLFEKLGIVQRLQTGWKYKLELTDVFHRHHHHATCILCDRSFILPDDPVIERQLAGLVSGIGFSLESHQLELRGHCTACQELLRD